MLRRSVSKDHLLGMATQCHTLLTKGSRRPVGLSQGGVRVPQAPSIGPRGTRPRYLARSGGVRVHSPVYRGQGHAPPRGPGGGRGGRGGEAAAQGARGDQGAPAAAATKAPTEPAQRHNDTATPARSAFCLIRDVGLPATAGRDLACTGVWPSRSRPGREARRGGSCRGFPSRAGTSRTGTRREVGHGRGNAAIGAAAVCATDSAGN